MSEAEENNKKSKNQGTNGVRSDDGHKKGSRFWQPEPKRKGKDTFKGVHWFSELCYGVHCASSKRTCFLSIDVVDGQSLALVSLHERELMNTVLVDFLPGESLFLVTYELHLIAGNNIRRHFEHNC